MSQSKSSKKWLKEHFKDSFVKRSKEEGYRSRSVYKLLEIQQKDKILKPGMTVIDLGAAPGGWSQLASELVGIKGKVIALDILPMDPLPHVEFIQGNFTEQAVLDSLLLRMGEHKAHWILSDMAPNISGIKTSDRARAMYLAELALDTAIRLLNPKGGILVKVFQGQGFESFMQQVRKHFKVVKIRKPAASRARSQEVYVLAQGIKGE